MNEEADGMGDVRLAFNAVPLLSPLTGVGQYTYRLITEMQALLAQPPWLFYGTSWQQELRTSAAPAARGVHNAIMRYLPKPHVVTRALKQARFSTGVRGRSIGLYHEPAYLAFRFRGPTVVTMHDISWIRHPETHPADRVLEMNRVMPGVISRAAHIVVDSDFVRGEVMSHYRIAPEKVTTVRLGVGAEFRPAHVSADMPPLQQLGLTPGRYILAVGTLEPRKNLASAVAAFARLPSAIRKRYPLVVVGMAGWRMEQFPDSLRLLLDRGEARLAGFVPQQELPALYAGARMLVYPSLYEGFGLPPLEAMACGIPVIASNRASLPEVVGNAGLLVEPQDATAIAHCMAALIDDDRLHAALCRAGLERAAMFTWRKFSLEMLGVYRKVLA